MTEITSRLSTALADRYKIERHLGEGGMATVYLAEDHGLSGKGLACRIAPGAIRVRIKSIRGRIFPTHATDSSASRHGGLHDGPSRD